MNGALTSAVVIYLCVVALLAVATALGAPVEPAARTGDLVGRVCVIVIVVIDVFSLVRGHRPAAPVTHLAYAACAIAIAPILTARLGEDRWAWAVRALAAFVTAVVLVRMAQTWA